MIGGTHDGVQGDQRGQGQGGHAGGGGGALAVTPELLVGHQPGQGGHPAQVGDAENMTSISAQQQPRQYRP